MSQRLRAALCGAALLAGSTPSVALAGSPAPVLASPPAPSRAEPEAARRRVVVLPLRAAGLSPPDREALARQLDHALTHPQLELVGLEAAELAELAELTEQPCDLECRRALAREREASHLVAATIEGSSREYIVTIELLTLDEDPTPERITAECSICGVAELGDQLAAQAAIARDRVLNTPSVASLVVLGEPAGARLSIDGVEVGELPYDGSLAPGEHELRVTARGHYARIIPLTAVAGVEENVRVDLLAKPRSRHWQRPLGWSAIGAGVASLSAGLTLLALDGQDVARRCRDDADPFVIDRDGDCRWVHQTLGAGAAMTTVAAGLLAAGTGLLIFDARQRQLDRPQTRVRLELGPTHAQLQLRF